MKIDIMGISETRWPGIGVCNIDGNTVYYTLAQFPQIDNKKWSCYSSQ